jgi:type I restriction enzyme M protein
VPPKSKWDWAFISHMVETTYEATGKVWVVIPHWVLFRWASEWKIRAKMIEENLLEAVIWLPANLFFWTWIPAAILVFNRGKKDNNVLFIDSSKEFEVAKNQNKLSPDNIDDILSTFDKFHEWKLEAWVTEEKYSYVATFDEIKENDFNLNIPRYVDTFVEEEEVEISNVQKEIKDLNVKLWETEKEMNKYLEELGF